MVVEFVDAGQGLAALVKLPDGRNVMIDTGENPSRPGCGAACRRWHSHVVERATAFLSGARLDLLWLTHPHADHVGGAVDVIRELHPAACVDSGLDEDKREMIAVHEALDAVGTARTIVAPGHVDVPLSAGSTYRLSAVVPSAWPRDCRTNANDCSIGLRIDYCESSVLFLGDAERKEEAALDVGHATLLQVPHHGSDTSTTDALLSRVAPDYAVVSAGRRDEGTNGNFCHPRVGTVERLTRALGGAGTSNVEAFDGALPCGHDSDDGWRVVPTSDRLWLTERDGDVSLVTTGDGVFTRRAP